MKNQATKLFNKNFVLLWQGQFVSQIGSQVAAVALIFWIKEKTDLASLMGLSSMIFSLTLAFVTPLGGTFADTYSRKKIFVLADVIAGVTSLLLAYVMFRFSDSSVLLIYVIFLAQFIFGSAAAFFNPAVFSCIPDLVPEKDLTKANSIKSSTIHFAMLVGQGAGGLIFTLFGGVIIFVANGISYLLSALSETFIHIPKTVSARKEVSGKNADVKGSVGSFLTNSKEGLQFIWSNPGMKRLVIQFGMSNFFLAPFVVLLPYYVELRLGLGPEWYGYLMGALGGGTFLGYILVSFLKISGKVRSKMVISLLIVFAFLSGSFGFVTNSLLAIVLFIIAGLILGLFNVVFDTAMQKITPSEMRGRVFGITGVLSLGLMPIGQALAGVVADLVNKNIPMIFLFAGIANFLITVYTFKRKEPYEILAYHEGSETDNLEVAVQAH